MTIKQHNTKEGRFYTYKSYKRPSVSYLAGYYQNKSFVRGWIINLGKKLLTNEEKVMLSNFNQQQKDDYCYKRGLPASKQAATYGTHVHELIETYLKNSKLVHPNLLQYINQYVDYLDSIEVHGLEEGIFYEDSVNDIGFGGTYDCYCTVNSGKFINDNTKKELDLIGSSLITDWKNPTRHKGLKKQYGDKDPIYPMVGYSLQLAAYRAGQKFIKPNSKIDGGIIYTAPRDRKRAYIYFFTNEELDWLWNEFVQLLKCYKHGSYFNFKEFCKKCERENLLGTPLRFKK